MIPHRAFQIAAFFGFLAVALGAFGAHGLKSALTTLGTVDSFEVAVRYQFFHALAMLVLARLRPFPAGPWWCFAIGILVFSGSLFVLALTGLKWLS